MMLPPGDEGVNGLRLVEVSAAALVKALAAKTISYANARNHVDVLVERCDPARNPRAYRRCQAAALPAVEPLLVLAAGCQSLGGSERVTVALEALTRICFDNTEAASTAVTSESFDSALAHALQQPEVAIQLEEHLAGLQFVQALASSVPEAPGVARVLPRVIALFGGGDAPYTIPGPARLVALEVLLSCALAPRRRKQVARGLSAPAIKSIIEGAPVGLQATSQWNFSVGLLLASLGDLTVPSETSNVQAEEQSEQLSLDTAVTALPLLPATSKYFFWELAQQFWDKTDFFGSLAASIDASIEGKRWPPETGSYHYAWKLAGACETLVSAGFGKQLHAVVQPLVQAVTRYSSELASTEDRLAASHAVAALRAMLVADSSCCQVVIEAMQSAGEIFAEPLREMGGADELSAQELLRAFSETS